MKKGTTRVRVFSATSHPTRDFQTAVSLHCHTFYSQEKLAFVPQYIEKIPFLARFVARKIAKYNARGKRKIRFDEGYWMPPLSPLEVFTSEVAQIETRCGLKALVSLTDHDDIKACQHLQILEKTAGVPISLEWTVPFGDGFFHLGVHHLPPPRAASIVEDLLAYTACPRPARLSELLQMLNESPETLVILNHPLWDIEGIGADNHLRALREFIARYGAYIHAFEINGYRWWHENREVLRMATELNYPAVSGGDRHGGCANAVLNLTRAAEFAEFAREVRGDKTSEILIMPAYREPLIARMLHTIADVLRYYPHHPTGCCDWTERIFVSFDPDEGVQPLRYWCDEGIPRWVWRTIKVLNFAGSRRWCSALRWRSARRLARQLRESACLSK